MNKKAASVRAETSNKLSHHFRSTDRKGERTFRVPRGLDPIGVQEWKRLVVERQGRVRGKALLLELTARTFSGVVHLRRVVDRGAHRRCYELLIKSKLRTYIGACQHLNCTPAVPDRREIP